MWKLAALVGARRYGALDAARLLRAPGLCRPGGVAEIGAILTNKNATATKSRDTLPCNARIQARPNRTAGKADLSETFCLNYRRCRSWKGRCEPTICYVQRTAQSTSIKHIGYSRGMQ